MKKLIGIFLLTLVANWGGQAQSTSGYFGSFHGAEIQFSGVPTNRRVNNLKIKDGEKVHSRRVQVLRMNYKFNYSFIVSRKVELTAGYEYANVHTPYYSYYDAASSVKRDLFQDLTFNRHGFNLNARFYRKGGIAPIGKFRGIGISYARLSMPDSVTVYHGQSWTPLESSGFFVRRNSINIMDTTELDVNSFDKYSTFSINVSAGRTFPVTQNILLTFSTSLNILSLYMDGSGGFQLGREVGPGVTDLLDSYSDRPINEGSFVDQELRDIIVLESLRAYNRVRLELGVKYFF